MLSVILWIRCGPNWWQGPETRIVADWWTVCQWLLPRFDSFFFRSPDKNPDQPSTSLFDAEPETSQPVQENTTIGVIATNLSLRKTEMTKLAQMAQAGVSRTTRPAHTLYDGDCLFALASGALDAQVELSLLGAVAAEVVAAAVLDGVLNAAPANGVPAASELRPPEVDFVVLESIRARFLVAAMLQDRAVQA